MITRTLDKNQTAAESLYTLLIPRTATSLTRKATQYADAMNTAHEVFGVLQYLCSECGVTIEEPHWRAGGTDDSIKEWCDAVFDQMHGDKIGRVKFEGDHAICTCYEVQKERGILNHALTRVKTTHMVLKPKLRKLPVSFDVPPKAQRMLDQIERVEVLRRSCRVLEGLLVGESEDVTDKWTERSAAGKKLDATGNWIKGNALNIGAGASAAIMGIGGIMEGIAAHSAPLAAVAVADPAVLLGNVCFYSWV